MPVTDAALTLIRNAHLYTPEDAGVTSLLLGCGSILHIGEVDPARLDLPVEIVEADGCVVAPGFVDAHQHLIGAGGEEGFGSRMPEVSVEEIVRAGITTVVGCLGTDTVTRHLTSLLGRVKQLKHEGISAFMYTGGFFVPPETITGAVIEDLVVVDEVIGVGEVAISNTRSTHPSVTDLARVVSDTVMGGMLSGKAGVTHFHVGSGPRALSPLHDLLDEYDIPPEAVYPTHITRSEKHMDQAIALARRGAFVDIDTVNEDFVRWARYYLDGGGPASKLTVSSDAHTSGGAPHKVRDSFVSAARCLGLPLQDVLPFFTRNPASALKLEKKGTLRPGADADLLMLEPETLALAQVYAGGRELLRGCAGREAAAPVRVAAPV